MSIEIEDALDVMLTSIPATLARSQPYSCKDLHLSTTYKSIRLVKTSRTRRMVHGLPAYRALR